MSSYRWSARAAALSLVVTFSAVSPAEPAGATPAAGASDMAASIKNCREQWDRVEALLFRVYGSNWKTAKLSPKYASFVSWRDETYAPLSSREYDLEAAGQVITSTRRSIKSDQELLDLSIARLKNDAIGLNKLVSDHNGEVERCDAAIARHNANPPDPKNPSAVAAYTREAGELNAWKGRVDAEGKDLARRMQQMQDRAAGLDRRQDGISERTAECDRKQSDQNEKEAAWSRDCEAAMERLRTCYEDLARMSERASENVHALDLVSRNFTRSDHAGQHGLKLGPVAQRQIETNNCKHFFLRMGGQLAQANPQAKAWGKDFGTLNADQIVSKLSRLSSTPGGQWTRVSAETDGALWEKLQAMANSGAVVVGASPAGSGDHGHIGFVSPTPPGLDPKQFAGNGPFVRDGNEHDFRTNANVDKAQQKVFPSTFGAVKASKAFPLKQTTWYLWNPSAQ